MEVKINVAEILKDKPQGIKLYDLLRNIDVELDKVHTTNVGTYIECTSTNDVGSTLLFDYSELGTEESWLEGLRILLPSKDMRDWSKFFKKGDVLICYEGKKPYYTIFDGFEDNTYRAFKGKFAHDCYEDKWYQNEGNLSTNTFQKLNRADSEIYVTKIEERFGGKLNRETLEIEKPQPEFKDGDIVMSDSGTIVLVRGISLTRKIYYHAYMRNEYIYINQVEGEFFSRVSRIKRFATDSEKQQLFDALAKKGKAWDAEKKQIVDLKPKCEFKPFDKVLGRNEKDDVWEAELFSHYREESQYPFRCIGFSRKYCIPYNEETAHLLGTTDDWEGGE